MPARHDSFMSYKANTTIKNPPCIISRQRKTAADGIGCPNWHDALEIQLCTEGSGYIIVNGKRHLLKKNDIAVINSDCTHYTGSEAEIEFMPMIISADFCSNADIDCRSLTFNSFISDEGFNSLFNDAVNIYFSKCFPSKTARLQAAVLSVLVELRDKYTVCERSLNANNPAFEQVKCAVKYIRDNFAQKLSLEQIARHSLTDKYSLSRSFKELTGLTVVQYINEYRCEEAAALIRSGAAVSEAAFRCGFNNISFFTKVFKKYTGMLPSKIKGGQ